MQVKKFEARTLKEAIEMVKTQLGPDAIILSVKDNKKKYGLVGEGSIEITAAVQNSSLHKKTFVETRIREEDKDKLLKSPAKIQKQFIEKMVDTYQKSKTPKVERPISSIRYIDIVDEETQQENSASTRIKMAVQRAADAMPATVPLKSIKGLSAKPSVAASFQMNSEFVENLQTEIASLKKVIADLKTSPTTGTKMSQNNLPEEILPSFERLVGAGVNENLVVQMLKNAVLGLPASKLKIKAIVDGWCAREILNSTKTISNHDSKFHIFVGPAGSGKTSSLVKLASQFVIKMKKTIAIVSVDHRKIGAHEQLRTYAQILNVPFVSVRTSADWEKYVDALASYDAVLVDTFGYTLKSPEELGELKALIPPDAFSSATHLVLSATNKDQDLLEIARRYEALKPTDLIFTKVDESVEHGVIYNVMNKLQKPLHSFGIGPRVPEDFEEATRERLVDLIFKLTKLRSQSMESHQSGVENAS
jgi:flagellar biosynthesis protein FlhF